MARRLEEAEVLAFRDPGQRAGGTRSAFDICAACPDLASRADELDGNRFGAWFYAAAVVAGGGRLPEDSAAGTFPPGICAGQPAAASLDGVCSRAADPAGGIFARHGSASADRGFSGILKLHERASAFPSGTIFSYPHLGI